MRPVRRLALLSALAASAAASTLAAQTPTRVASAAAPRSTAPEPARDTAIAKLSAFLARYPNSPLRPNALFQLGELLVRRADAEFEAELRATSGDSTHAGEAPVRPAYEPAIERYEELVRRYPDYQQIDAVAYTLGTLQYRVGRYADAARSFELVTADTASRFRPESYFRLGDSYFELAARERGAARQAQFARAAEAYERAVNSAPKGGDIYFLSLYKLGWSYYNQATRSNQAEYRQAVDVFGRLVAEYDRLTPEQQAKLGLRGEAIEYMAIAFTQVGGAEAANRFFASRGGDGYRLPVLQKVASNLRDQGQFVEAVDAYRAVIQQAPTDSGALSAQRQIVDIYQNRAREPEKAQAARLELVERFAPGTPWAQANPQLADTARVAREEALRQSGQYALAQAQQRGDRAQYARAAELYGRYMQEFAQSDSAQVVNLLYGEALFGQGEYARAGAEYERAAYQFQGRSDSLAQRAGQNAVVAYDSALVRNKGDRAAQDAFFGTVDRYVAAFPQTEIAKRALIEKGRRASETQRWDVMAETFRTYAARYPNDPYTPTAQKLVADAMYRQGSYAEAQQQWERAQEVALSSGRRALADSIQKSRTAAAATYADTLVKQGEYRRAAEEVYVAFAEKNPTDPTAPDALRNAIETYMLADSVARAKGDEGASRAARDRAIELSGRLVSQYPNYKYRLQYQNLQARLLAESGRREEAVEPLRAVVASSTGAAKADAMVRLAVTLDSLGRKPEAAQAYEQFAAAFPRDQRAAGAQYNAAVTYREAGDQQAAARAFGTFVTKFPRDARVAEARQARLDLLRASGDTTAANAELARLCANPTAELRAECSAREGERAFRQGVALWPRYKSERLVIRTVGQLTQAGVQRASASKQSLLRTMTGHFTRAIRTGSPEWLSAATYYVGLAQWEYGEFLKNVQLPESLTEEQRQAALQGAAQQAQANYDAARKTWQSLVDKAAQEKFSNAWVDRARDALSGNVPESPPTSMRDGVPATIVGGEE
ncbi:MAG TPA: tetratricopeptide repeat protein [Gemmatimonadaceae bacterium]|nr:tetratricopeptide repeat protein [Gemmatimonadaceae bacterium]